MKKIFTGLLLLLSFSLFASPTDPSRIYVDSSLAPFYHGVASGDPTQTAVIIWTRLTTAESNPQIDWQVATDTLMQNVVQSGTTTTSADRDYTIKVDVQGLQPNTYYFYEFKYNGQYSLRGRTKTLPDGNVSQARFAVVSCASYSYGYFNVYQAINGRNDVDAVIHLGDYIYEYGKDEYGTTRVPDPVYETVTLADYRIRYSSYRLDSMLMRLHQQFPFYTIWDDHEFADNAYVDGAENHQPATEGDWNVRKRAAMQAYNEWMPIRKIDTIPNIRIYRTYSIGNLLDLFLMDTRISARQKQIQSASLTGIDDSTHYLFGPLQYEWLKDGFQNSTATWKVVGQQVMVAPFKILNLAFNDDQWDGYPSERKKFFKMVNDLNMNNLVMLSADIHSAWANDFPFGKTSYNPQTGAGSAGVEFINTSVTSPGIPLTGIVGTLAAPVIEQIVKDNNPYVKHNNFVNRGFTIVDFTPQRAQADFYNIETIDQPNANYYQVSYYTEKDSNHLKKDTTPTHFIGPLPVKAPLSPRQALVTGITNKSNTIEITGVYPNPFVNFTGIQYSTNKNSSLTVSIFNTSGQLVYYKDLGNKSKGVYFEKFDLSNLPVGEYVLALYSGTDVITRPILKTE